MDKDAVITCIFICAVSVVFLIAQSLIFWAILRCFTIPYNTRCVIELCGGFVMGINTGFVAYKLINKASTWRK